MNGLLQGDPIVPVPGTVGGGGKAGEPRHELGGRLTCRRIEEPSDEQVEELLGRYTDGLRRLFDQYKAQAGYPDATLEFWG